MTEKLLSSVGRNLFISGCTTYALPTPNFFLGGVDFFSVVVSDRSTPGAEPDDQELDGNFLDKGRRYPLLIGECSHVPLAAGHPDVHDL